MVAPAFLDKIVPRGEAARRVAVLAQPVVFTNGVFDVLHRGHVTYLAQSRALGGSLIVALNTDASARRLNKGADRPLNREQDRATVIAALGSVDLVTWFDEDTPLALIQACRPEILVKGGDWPAALGRPRQLGQQFFARPMHGQQPQQGAECAHERDE